MTQRRNRRSGVEDRWRKADGSPSANDGKGKRWRARYVDSAGVEVAKSFAKKIDAANWLDEVTSSIVTGSYVAPGAGKATIGQLHAQWVGTFGHLKETTKAARESVWAVHVRNRWEAVSVGEILTSEVRAWVADMRAADVNPATIENAAGCLRMICEMAVEDRRIPRNPCTGVKLPPRQTANRAYLTHQQVAELATAAMDYGLVVRFLAYTGLRYGEMAALRVHNIDMLRRRIDVRQSVTEVRGGLVWSSPKSHERRTVPFPRFLVDDLATAMTGKGRDDLVFTAPMGGVLRIATFRSRHFRQAVESLRKPDDSGQPTTNFPRPTIHDLRHTAASLAISSGANVKAVQTMLGHKSAVLTLDTYADLFPDDLGAVADAFDAAVAALG